MWNKISVGQYQLISRLKDSKDAHVKLIGILNDMTEKEISEQSDRWRIKEAIKLNFLKEEPAAIPKDYIKVNGREYKVNYDVKRMPCSRYIEVKHFGHDVYENMHKIAASMVLPVFEAYDSSKHEVYSNDMMDAPFLDVYGSLIKFLNEIAKLDSGFPTLWEGGNEEGDRHGSNFPKIFGWQYQVSKVAEHERVTLDEAYNLPTLQFLNDISYIIAFNDWNKTTN